MFLEENMTGQRGGDGQRERWKPHRKVRDALVEETPERSWDPKVRRNQP